jgi:putative redox protein
MRDVIVRGVTESGMAMQVEAGPHTLRGDEPTDQGGTDTGPQPHELLLAALGTCTLMTLRMYAGRKGWPMGNTRVRLNGAKAADGSYAIDRHIHFDAALDADQRTRLIEIADKCPVHKTLKGQIAIATSEAG